MALAQLSRCSAARASLGLVLLRGQRRWKGRGRGSDSCDAAGCTQFPILKSSCPARGSSSRCSPASRFISRPTNAPTQPLQKCALRITHAENTSRVDSWHAELAAPQSPPLTRPGRTLGDARKDLAGATFQLGATPDPEASIAEMRRFKEEVLSRLWPHRALCVGTGRAQLSRRPVARFCPIGSIPRLTPWQWSWHRAMLQRAAPAVP